MMSGSSVNITFQLIGTCTFLSRKALCDAAAPYLPFRGKPFQTRPTMLVRLQLVP